MRLPLLVVLIATSVSAFAQSWTDHYQKALSAYQQEDFATALAESKAAIQLSKDDRKNAAFAQQIFTASALALEQFNDGLAFIDAEIENFAAIEPNGTNYLEAMRKKGALLAGAGKYDASAAAYAALLKLSAQVWAPTSYEHLTTKAAQGEALMHAKKFAEAQQAFAACLAGLRAIPDAGEDYIYALFNAAYVDLMLEDHAGASNKLSKLVPILEANDLTGDPMYADAKEMLSRANVGQGSSADLLPADRVRQLFEKAFAAQDVNHREAIALYRQCENIIATHGIVNNTTFSVYLNHARLAYAVGDFTTAQSLLVKAREHAVSFDNRSVEQGHIAILEADLALRSGDIAMATSHYDRGMKNIMSAPPSVWVKQVRWVADQLVSVAAGERAIPFVKTALQHQDFPKLPSRDQIILYQYLGRLHVESRQTDALVGLVKPLVERTADAEIKQALLLVWAQAEKESSDLDAARQRLARAVDLNPSGAVVGELYFEMARLDQRQGDYRQAEVNYHNALKYIARAPLSEIVTPLVFNSIAAFYIELGNYAAAEEFFLNLLAREDGAAFFNDVRQNLAALYQQTGRYDEAKSLLIRALSEDALAGTEHPDYAIALQNLAAVYQNLVRLDSAQLLYEQALRIDERHFGAKSLPFATKLTNLGTVYQEGGKFNDARTMFEKALSIRRALLPADHPDLAFSEFTLANLLYRTQKPREAMPLFASAADFYLRQIHRVFPALSDYERTAFYNRIKEIIDNYEMFLIENLDLDASLAGAVMNFRLQTKALLLNSSLKVRNQILHSGDASLVRDFQVWQHTKEQLAYFMMMPKAEREQHDALYRELVAQANDLEKSLSLKSDAFTSAFLPELADWRKIGSALKPGEAALEIVRVKLADRDSVVYAALVVKPGAAKPEAVVLPDGKFLEQKAFNRYINSIRYQVDDPVSYGYFWSRLQPLLGEVKHLYLSADGVFNKINCATLFDNASGQYVADRMDIVLVSNLLDLTRDRTKTSSASTAMLVGAPDYRLDARQTLAAVAGDGTRGTVFTNAFRSGFSPLPGTQVEVTEVGQLLKEKQWQVNTLMQREASEENLKEAKDIGLLHIATHGFFVAPKDEHAQEIFSRDLKDVETNSMLRSGLILAGAEKHLIDVMSGKASASADDGVLTAYEVMNLNLDKTELVVLSACETGMGDVKNGEGVYGLQRAFLLAGARNVIMSLWKVDDKATQELMSAFYSEWLKGKDKSEAFHAAQLKMKEKFGHPFYWGAFVLVGR